MTLRLHDPAEIARLASLQQLLILDTAREPLFDTLVRQAAQACGAPIALITLVDAERQWFKADVGLGGLSETPREYSFCTHTILSDELLEVPDARDDARFAGSPFVRHDPGVRFYAGVPLVLADGERVGSLCVLDVHARRLDCEQRRTLQSLATLTVQALTMRRDLIARTLAVRSDSDAALAAREAELDDLYTNAPCGYYSLDADARIVRINDTALRWLGCTRTEVVGKLGIVDFLDPEGRDYFNARFPRLKRDGRMFDIEYDLVGRNGMRRHVAGSASAVRAADGSFVMTRTMVHDISELHRTREHLRKLGSEQQSILDTDLVGIFKVKDRKIAWANKGAEKIFGCPLADIVGRPTREFYPDESAWLDFGTASRSRLAAGHMYRTQLQMRRRDGTPILVDTNVSPMPGQPGEVLCVLVDISDLKRAEEGRIRANALEAENRQLTEAARVKGVFLSNMSHELYTPLNAIIGYSHLLGTGAIPADSPRFAKYLGDIGASGQQLLAKVQSVLAFTDAESGRFDLRPQTVDLRGALQSVIDMAQPAASPRGVALTLAMHDDPVELVVDPMRLSQVVAQFVDNAVRFSHVGGGVTVRARRVADGECRIEVVDQGIGIEPDALGTLFTPFRQLSDGLARTHTGAGLGLALVRRLAQALGGNVAVDSQPGVGSVFSLTLPCRPRDAGATPA